MTPAPCIARVCLVSFAALAMSGCGDQSYSLHRTFDDPTVTSRDVFGWSVALDGDRALIGAPGDGTQGADVGQAHLFDTTNGALLRTLDDPTPSLQDRFGYSVALDGNRYLAGVYKDLGDLYYDAYETNVAWDCWDAARKIAPSLEMLDSVRDLEEHLETAYPRFF